MATRNLAKDKRNFVTALKDARLGIRQAQYEVGLMYANGIGVEQDFVQAIDWIRQSAERGLAAAQYLLATRYANGVGVEQDEHEACKWFIKAVDQGHPKAVYRLGRFFSKPHPVAASSLFQKAAHEGVAEAQFALATDVYSDLADSHVQQQAFDWCLRAAEQGLAAAQCALGDRYAHGIGVHADTDQAFIWYRKAAKQNHAAALVAMSLLDESGLGRDRSGGRARRYSGTAERRQDAQRWVDAAESGDAEAKYCIGMMFEHGWSVAQDRAQAQGWYQLSAQSNFSLGKLALARLLEENGQDEDAVEWYEKAAISGAQEAVCALGRLYMAGRARSIALADGVQWAMKSAQLGDLNVMMKLATMFGEGRDDLALTYLEMAASGGSAQAQYQMGQRYESNSGASAINDAITFYQRAADQGHVLAQSALGVIFLEGSRVAKNPVLARDWLEKAAEQKDAKAQWNLALLLISGSDGVKKDLKQAFLWCQKAANSEFVPAQATLGTLYARMKKMESAVQWWQLAADQGDPEAQYNLANAISKGQGTLQNSSPAFEWFVKAAEQGVVPAQSKVGVLYATGEGVALDLIEACKWFLIASAKGDGAAKTNRQRSQAQLSSVQFAEAQRRATAWLTTST